MNVKDYVRTKYGIAKIIDLKENPCGEKTIYVLNKSIINIYDCDGGELAWCNPFIEDMQNKFDTKFGDEKCIVKSSPNIIDLIEVGDYVNGKRVEWIGYDLYRENEDKTLTGIGEKRILFNEFTKDSVREKGIKSIVTREMFESMEYKVGE